MFDTPTNQGLSTAPQPGQAAGQPVTPNAAPQPANPQAQADAPVFVTKAEITALETKLLAEMKKTAQSSSDKVKNQVLQKLETLKTYGIQATEEQAAAMLQAEQSQQPQTQQQPVTQQGQPAQVANAAVQTNDPVLSQAAAWMQEDKSPSDPITAEAYRKMATAGVRITDDDKESSMIKGGNVSDWLASVDLAIAAKTKRLEIQGTPIRTPNLSSGTPSSKPTHSSLNGQDTLEAYFSNK